MRPRGVLPSLRTVSRARTAIWCTSGRRWTSRSKPVNVTAWRSASCGDRRGEHLRRIGRAGLGRGLAVLVNRAGEDDLALRVLRCRLGCGLWLSVDVGGVVVWAGALGQSGRAEAGRKQCKREQRNFMNPGLSVLPVWTRRAAGRALLESPAPPCGPRRGAGGRPRRGPRLRRRRHSAN